MRPAIGAVTLAPDGKSVSYATNGAFQGLKAGATATEVFTYTMADSLGAQSSASVTVTVKVAVPPTVRMRDCGWPAMMNGDTVNFTLTLV